MNKKENGKAPDVLIVGAGPAGLTLACELVRRGIHVRIIDEKGSRSPWSRASVIHARTLEIFEDLGIAKAALLRGRKVSGLRFFSGDTCIGHVSVDGVDSPYPFMLGLPQQETELLLEEQLLSLGIAVERGASLLFFEREVASVSATIGLPGGQSETVRVPWLVGCDGENSLVRRTIEIPFAGSSCEETLLQADVRLRFPSHDRASGRSLSLPDDEGFFFISSRGAISALPLLPSGRHRVQILLGPDERSEPTLETFRRLMESRGPSGTVVDDPAWLAAFEIKHRLVPHYRDGQVFLVGDAAHVVSPVGGQGMNLGIQDAYNLGWKLALVVRGKARPSLLDSYELERRPIAAATAFVTDAMTRAATHLLGLEGSLSRRIRDQVVGLATRLPLVEDRISAALEGTAVDYRRSPIVDQYRASVSTTRRVALEGPTPGPLDWLTFDRGPSPGERIADLPLSTKGNPPSRLFDLVHGPGHTLLLFAGAGETESGYRALSLLAAEVRAFHGDAVAVHVVAPPGHVVTEEAPAIQDEGGILHRRFGARFQCSYLVRPDGYLAYRSQPIDSDRLLGYLDSIFS